MKGQSGYGILAPVTARFASRYPNSAESCRRLGRSERAQPGETTRTKLVGLRPALVCDVPQTVGAPTPEPPAPTLLSEQAPLALAEGLAPQLAPHRLTHHHAPVAAPNEGATPTT